jgi:hypothetical protein
MGRTPDRRPGQQIEDDAIAFDDRISDTGVVGTLYRKGDDFFAHDSVGAFNLRTGGSGITASQHKALRDLIHFVSEGPADGFTSGAYLEVLPSADPFPTSEIWWTDSGKTDKIVELTTTYNGNKTIATEVWKMYDTDGSTVLVTLTDTYAYSGVFVTTVTRTWA